MGSIQNVTTRTATTGTLPGLPYSSSSTGSPVGQTENTQLAAPVVHMIQEEAQTNNLACLNDLLLYQNSVHGYVCIT